MPLREIRKNTDTEEVSQKKQSKAEKNGTIPRQRAIKALGVATAALLFSANAIEATKLTDGETNQAQKLAKDMGRSYSNPPELYGPPAQYMEQTKQLVKEIENPSWTFDAPPFEELSQAEREKLSRKRGERDENKETEPLLSNEKKMKRERTLMERAKTDPRVRRGIKWMLAKRRLSEQKNATMVVRGFDHDVAQAHGYRIVKVNGTEASVKDDVTSLNDASPANTINGNCGSSFVYLEGQPGSPTSARSYAFSTGFNNLRLPADLVSWDVDVAGPNGYTRDWPLGGAIIPPSTSWNGAGRSAVDDSGWYDAQVLQSSWALLIDGSLCTSAGPESRAEVP
jgi:hypothetical protein